MRLWLPLFLGVASITWGLWQATSSSSLTGAEGVVVAAIWSWALVLHVRRCQFALRCAGHYAVLARSLNIRDASAARALARDPLVADAMAAQRLGLLPPTRGHGWLTNQEDE